MIDHDRLFKELISTFFLEFIDLFFPKVRDYIEEGSLELLDKEIFTSGERHEVDLLAKLRFKGEQACFLIHVENQAQPQSDFGRRMFTYFARLYEKHDLPVYPIAVFTYPAPQTEQGDSHRVTFPDRTILDFRYRVIQLNRLNWREYVRRDNPVASALMAKMKIDPSERAKVKFECIRLLATLKLNTAKTQMVLDFVDAYLRLSEDEDKTYQGELEELTVVEKERVMEVTMSWRERALQQGKLSLVTHLIEHRFGALEDPLKERLHNLSSDQLEKLGDALFDFTGLGDLANWLQRES